MADVGMARKRPQSEPVVTITQLVRAHLDNGKTLRQLESESGGVVAYTQFDKISKGQISQWPRSAEAVHAMARALEVDARQIVLSYAAQFGVDVREPRSTLAAMLPAGADRLTPRQARALATLVKTFVEEEPATGRLRAVRDEAAQEGPGSGDGERKRKPPKGRNSPRGPKDARS